MALNKRHGLLCLANCISTVVVLFTVGQPSSGAQLASDGLPQVQDLVRLKPIQAQNQHNQQQQPLVRANETPISTTNGNSSKDNLEDWNFEMVEYDLMDYLENLGARYKSLGKPQVQPTGDNSQLEAKQNEANTTTSSSQVSMNATSTERPEPALPQTSLAPGDFGEHDIGESKWQYGIFDRFTRPRATSTTQEPRYTVEPGVELDMRHYNENECGLRTYDTGSYAFPSMDELSASSSEALDANQMSEATKDLNQRRQRPGQDTETAPVPNRRVTHFESVADYMRKREPSNNQQQLDETIMKWPNLDEKRVYDRFKEHIELSSNSNLQQQHLKQNNELPPGDEFNLLSRRNWLQQQIGSTLQMFGFNTSEAASWFANQPQPNSLAMIGQNATKMPKSLNHNSQPSSIEGMADSSSSISGRQDELKLEARVIGGSDARLGDSPWSVSLQALVSRPGTGAVEYRHYCGGTIISEYYVLTAAHCLDFMVGRESRLFVVIGDLNWRMNPASQFGRRFGIDKLIIHSSYKNTAFGHDIGLIRTKERMRPLKVNGKFIINSVCLPEKNIEHSGDAELVGWGLFSNRNEMADSLQIADVPILPRPLCVDLYRRRTGLIQWLIGIELITDKQVCAGTFGRGICQGDSGSALVVNDRSSPMDRSNHAHADNSLAGGFRKTTRHRREVRRTKETTRATIIGVVAFGGIRRCSYQSLPGVYMQTSKYMDWILPRIQSISK